MKIKKILSTVISAAMCLSLLSANVSADEFVQQVTFENSVLLSSKTPNVDMSVNNMFPMFTNWKMPKTLLFYLMVSQLRTTAYHCILTLRLLQDLH